MKSRERHFRLRGRVSDAEVSYSLSSGLNLVGSDASKHVVLDHDGVSRHHALILVEASGITVVDQGSKNGTFLSSRRIHQAKAGAGDQLAFGPVELRLEEIIPAMPGWPSRSLPEDSGRSRRLGMRRRRRRRTTRPVRRPRVGCR